MLNDFPRDHIHDKCPVIQVLNRKLTASQRRKDIDLHFSVKVVLRSLESFVRFLFHNDDDIAWFNIWCLVALAREGDMLATLHPLIDVHLKELLLGDHLLAHASFTPVPGVDDFAITIALVTRLLHLLDHRTKLSEDSLNAHAVTATTLPHSTFLAALAVTFGTDNMSSKSELRSFALV